MTRAALRRLLAGFCLAVTIGCVSTRQVIEPPAIKPREEPAVRGVHHDPQMPPVPSQPLPITLDTVLRLAGASNSKIALAREKLHESQLHAENAGNSWIPNVYAGGAYYRHEGGIQNEIGTLTHSSTGALYFPGVQIKSELDLREATFKRIDHERKEWQQKAELSQVNSEVLVEAAQCYVDLLAARRAEALSCELARYELKILRRSEKLAETQAAYDSTVANLKSALNGRSYQAAHFRQQGDAASAKLVYLLGLPPGSCLMPIDLLFVPIELIEPAPCDVLIARALSAGPTVQELAGLVATIQEGLDRSYGIRNFLPTVGVCISDGLFGAGPGGSMSFDNRFDFNVQVKWNLTGFLQAEQNRTLVRSRLEQSRWTLLDVQQKLAAGVQEASQTIKSSRELIGHAMAQIHEACRQYDFADKRLEDGEKGSQPLEVILAIKSLESAHFNYLQTVREHNKGQVRLMMLVGCTEAQEKKLTPPVTLPPPGALKGPREEKNDDKPEQLPPPKPQQPMNNMGAADRIRTLPMKPAEPPAAKDIGAADGIRTLPMKQVESRPAPKVTGSTDQIRSLPLKPVDGDTPLKPPPDGLGGTKEIRTLKVKQ